MLTKGLKTIYRSSEKRKKSIIQTHFRSIYILLRIEQNSSDKWSSNWSESNFCLFLFFTKVSSAFLKMICSFCLSFVCEQFEGMVGNGGRPWVIPVHPADAQGC